MASRGDLPWCRMACICSVMGISTPRACARPTAAEVVKTPSATMPCMPAMISGSFLSAAEFDADAAIARQASGAGEHEVAEAGESGHGFGAASAGDDQAGHFGKAAGDEGGDGVVAEAEAVADSGGDGDDVFQRSAEFDADDIAVGVDAKTWVAEFLLHGAQEGGVLRGDGDGGGIAASDFLGEGWAAEGSDAGAESSVIAL